MSELPLITQICESLSQGPATAIDLARQLGTVESEGRSAVYVKPAAPAFQQIIVSRDRSSGETRSVELTLARPGSLTVAELSRAFGSYQTPPKVSWDSPNRVRFSHDLGAERPRLCIVSATLAEGATGDQAAVASLTLIPEGR